MERGYGAVPCDAPRRWTLAAAHRERLLGIARTRVAVAADAEDVVSEAMLLCVLYVGLDEARIASLLTTLTLRLCVNQHRLRARELRAGTAVLTREIADVGPEDAVCDRAEAEWVASLAQTLPHRQREALRLKASGLDVTDAALTMDLSYKAVESALSRGRSSLRGRMAAES
ncbi:MAG TPA: sigma-70 family RNA polymerase sigma factor [Frankiaceae bacterium]|jgi:RNA polymerase sigma factor (sigma-70 family)|nr:sigma-70 family RNA polymerase sigma factor [Frankiaceae bacterium]